MAGLGEVKVSLGLDTSKAKSQMSEFFSSIGKDPIKNPLKELDNSLKNTGQNAQKLGKDLNGIRAEGLKNIGKDAKQVGTDLKNLGEAGRTLDNTLKNIGKVGGIKQLGNDAKLAQGSVDSLANGSKTLGSAISGLNKAKPLPGMKATLDQINSSAKTTTTTFGTLKTALDSAGQGGKSLTQLPTGLAAVKNALNGVKGATTGVGTEFAKAKSIGEGFLGSIKGGFASLAQGIPQGIGLALGNSLLEPLRNLAGVIPAAVAEFSALDEQLRLTLEISGAGAAKFGELQNAALSVSSQFAATAVEVAQVQQALARAGFALDEIKSATPGIIQGAEATGTAYATMGDIVVSALGAFGLEATDTTDVVDTLTVAANSSNQSVSDLGEAIKYVGPVASATGQSLQDVSLALELLANNGIRGSQAGTSFRTILTNLQIAASGAGEEFKGLSRGSARLEKALELIGANMTDTNGELLQGKDLILELQRSMDGLSTGEKALVSKALAGSEGLPAMNALINASGEQIDKLADGLENRAGTAADQAKNALAGLSGAFKILESNVSAALVQIGAIIATALTPLINAITGVLSLLNGLPGPIKNLLVTLGLVGAAIGAVVVSINLLKGTKVAEFFTSAASAIVKWAGSLSAANASQILGNWTSSIVNFGKAAKAQLILGLTNATKTLNNFSKTLQSIKVGQVLGNISQGFQNFAGVVSQKGIPTALKGISLGAKGAGAALSGIIPALGGFIAAAAPFVAIGAGIAATWVAITRRWEAAKAVADPLQKSQDDLDAALRRAGEGGETAAQGYTGWGKAIEDALGPLDRLLNFTGPLYHGVKAIAEILGKVDDWNRNSAAVNQANQDYAQFQKSMDATNAKIEENRAKMANLNPESEEFGRLATQNAELINAEKTAVEDRVAAIDQTINKLKENEGANRATIEALQEMKGKYQEQLPVIEANLALIQSEKEQYESLTGEVQNYTLKLNEATKAREDAFAKADAQVLYEELEAYDAIKKGLINDAEARAVNAKAQIDASDDKIAAVENEMTEIQRAYDDGAISLDEYNKRMDEAYKSMDGLTKERITNEKAAADALKAAIDSRIAEYEREAQSVADNIQKINTAIGQIQQVRGTGISAFKTLAQEVTNAEIQGIDQAKDRRLKSIDETKNRELQAIEASGLEGEAATRAREKAEARAASAREEAERNYVSERKAIMQKQIDFEKKALEAQIELKKAELELWYQQQTVATELAIAQNAAAQARAEAAGDEKLISALQKEEEILGKQLGQLDQMRTLKEAVLGVEEDIGKQQIATKASAEGVSSGYGKVVTSIENVSSRLDTFLGRTKSLENAWQPLRDGLGEIPTDVKARVEESKRVIEAGFGEVSFEGLKQAFIKNGITPAVAAESARRLTEAFDKETQVAGDIASNNILGRFGDAIPKDLIKDQLMDAFVNGADLSVTEAERRFNQLPEKLPAARAATVLANAMGAGIDQGYAVLASTPLPPGLFGGTGMALTTEIQSGVNQSTPVLESLGQAAYNGFSVFNGQLPQLGVAVATWAQQAGTDISSGFQTGQEEGWASIRTAANAALTDIGANFSGVTLGDMTTSFISFADSITGYSQEAGQSLNQAMAEGLNEAVVVGAPKFVEGLANTIIPGAGTIASNLVEQFGGAGKAAGDLMGEENATAFLQKTERIKNGIIEFFTGGDLDATISGAGEVNGFNFAEGFTRESIPVINQFADTVGERFGNLIPKEDIIGNLEFALEDGTLKGNAKAAEIIAKLPDAIPREEVARILGEGLGEGAELGEDVLNNIQLQDDFIEGLARDLKTGFENGGTKGAQAIEDKVEEVKDPAAEKIADALGDGFSEGAKRGGERVIEWSGEAGRKIGEGIEKGASDSAPKVVETFKKEFAVLKQDIQKIVDELDTKGLKQNLETALNDPVKDAVKEMGNIRLPDGFGENLGQAGLGAQQIADSGFAQEINNAARGAEGLNRDTRPIAGSISRAIGPANSLARALERAARAAADAARARFAGGPVQSGQTYTVNELGPEMFMSKSGKLSDIKAPAFGDWRAPSSGTVIPAGIAQQIRASQEAREASVNITSLQGTASPRISGTDGTDMSNVILKGLKGLGGGTNQSVVNNVQIQSQAPVNDASRILTDLARLRSTRRRR